MAGVARPLTLQGWARRIRSAAVHASPSRLRLTAARWAAQSLNPRSCLRAELERLRQEIRALREEIRIKDAACTSRSPEAAHYATERLAILNCGLHATGFAQTAGISS